MTTSITNLATAVPPHLYSQPEIYRQFEGLLQLNPISERLFANSGIETRHFVISKTDLPAIRDGVWPTSKRQEIYKREAPRLGAEAVKECLRIAGVKASDIDYFVVATCTGCMTPGLDILLAAQLGMRTDLERTHLGGIGCYAAFPALKCAAHFLKGTTGKTALVLCVEVCSVHLQPGSSNEAVVSNSLFADGAAAVLLRSDETQKKGVDPEIVDSFSWTDYSTADKMTWEIGDTGFHMSLSSYVPQIIGSRIADFVGTFLHTHKLKGSDISFWGVHPGGPKILQEVATHLNLSEKQMEPSWTVLKKFGNMSSATILFILQSLLQGHQAKKGDYGVLLGFGPGLTLEACLLKWG